MSFKNNYKNRFLTNSFNDFKTLQIKNENKCHYLNFKAKTEGHNAQTIYFAKFYTMVKFLDPFLIEN